MMAFEMLCSSRLFHGFKCKSSRPVVFSSAICNNVYLIGAFLIGAVLDNRRIDASRDI